MASTPDRPILLAAASDLHCGSAQGLCPGDGVELDGGATYLPSPAARTRWGYWLRMWRRVAQRRDELGADLAVLLNGDLTDGKVFRDQDLIDSDVATQIEVAVSALAPMLELKPSRIFVSRGTPVHVGMRAGLEEGIARQIGAEPDPTTPGARTAYSWAFRLHSKLIYATHHPPSAGRLVRTRQSQAALTANEVANRFWERGLDAPDVAIFSHKHEPVDTGPVLPHRKGTRVLQLGPWQAKTQYAHKVAPVAMEECHAAMVTVWPDPHRPEYVEHCVYPLQTEVAEVELAVPA